MTKTELKKIESAARRSPSMPPGLVIGLVARVHELEAKLAASEERAEAWVNAVSHLQGILDDAGIGEYAGEYIERIKLSLEAGQ